MLAFSKFQTMKWQCHTIKTSKLNDLTLTSNISVTLIKFKWLHSSLWSKNVKRKGGHSISSKASPCSAAVVASDSSASELKLESSRAVNWGKFCHKVGQVKLKMSNIELKNSYFMLLYHTYEWVKSKYNPKVCECNAESGFITTDCVWECT